MKPEVDTTPLSLTSLPLKSTSDPYATTYSIGLKLLATMDVSNRARLVGTGYVGHQLRRQLFEKLYGHLREPIVRLMNYAKYQADPVMMEESRRLSDALWKAFYAPLEGESTLTGERATETLTT